MTDATRDDQFFTEHFSPVKEGDTQPYMQIVGEPADRASLFAKIVQLNKSVKKLKHTGKFNAGNTKYTYATEADVIEPIAKALADAGIATIPSVVEQWWHDLPGKYGANRVCTVHAQMLLADSETGAYIVAHTFSTAANGDKASNAAFTTAIKYLLAKLTLVAFGDDADEYTVDGDKADGSAKPKAKAKSAPRAASQDARDKLMNEIVEAGKGEDAKAHLKANKLAWSKLTDNQLTEIRSLLLEG